MTDSLPTEQGDTPKTDAELIPYAGGHVVRADFARAQERRITELQRDADRYRWLRHGDNDELVLYETDGATFILRNEDLDDAIDEQLEDEAAIQDAQP